MPPPILPPPPPPGLAKTKRKNQKKTKQTNRVVDCDLMELDVNPFHNTIIPG